MSDTFKMEVEYTDTFSGEANYCWVKRAELELPQNASKKLITQRCKRAMGLSGVRGTLTDFGDEIHFKPYGMCTILMARVVY